MQWTGSSGSSSGSGREAPDPHLALYNTVDGKLRILLWQWMGSSGSSSGSGREAPDLPLALYNTVDGKLVCNSAPPAPHIPPPFGGYLKSGKKRRFDTFFGRCFAFRKLQNAVNYSIFAFCCLLREPCKNAENAVNTNTFSTRDAQITANTSVFESKTKKHCKLQHLWRVDRTKCWYLDGFYDFNKT